MHDVIPVALGARAAVAAPSSLETELDGFVARIREHAAAWDRAGTLDADARRELDGLRPRLDPGALCDALGRGESLGAMLACLAPMLASDLAAACGLLTPVEPDVTCAMPWFDVPSLTLTQVDSGFTLSGRCEAAVDAAARGHLLLAVARETFALVPIDAPGLALQPREGEGLGSAGLARVSLSGVPLQAAQVKSLAPDAVARIVERHRLWLARALCAYARSLFQTSLQFVGTRRFRAGKLVDLPVTRHRLADLAAYPASFDAQLRAAEADTESRSLRALLVLETLAAQLPPFVKHCQQLHGGRGFLADHTLARAYRDNLALPILVGSARERQRAIAARASELDGLGGASACFASAEHAAFRSRARTQIAEHVASPATDWDRDPLAMASLHARFARENLTTLRLGRTDGGGGYDFGFSVILAEELAATGPAGVAVSLMIAAGAVVPLLEREATAALRARLWPQLRDGEAVLAFGITEPEGGSDLLHSLRTEAKLDGDAWVLNGRKMFITNGPIAGYILVLARTSGRPGPFHASFLVVPVASPGVTVSAPYDTLGLCASPTGYVDFRDVRVPQDHLIGRAGLGMHYLADSISEERTLIAVGALGLASRLVGGALSHAAASGDGSGCARLVSWYARLDALRARAAETALAIVRGERDHAAAGLVKLAACEAVQDALEAAAEVLGQGEPAWCDPELTRALRDARVFTVFAGTTETLRELVGASIAARARLASKVGPQ